MAKEKLTGEATKEQVDKWKEEHGDVFAIKCEGNIFYFKKPDRKILGYSAVAGKTNPMKFNETLFKSCFLGGSNAHIDDNIFFGLVDSLAELVKAKETEMVNL
ncbi:MAG: hypothetical protein WCL00_00150 [Bacteroidota bacterium]